ncbi:glucose-6-phosphate isomerase [Tahibacter amnicola]|uniref:Glucose-6-phosphate isomerase n=1 Tax=Tahibacter amnicola TaxID=2976241 RepID=A0ABY6BA13_9GAMM|nr:glucose-6-phosphate isomerase [Tahibacter amnicola]UXI66908.1 glucose-6-phosphate isomerase [Tahibacter amnicola]
MQAGQLDSLAREAARLRPVHLRELLKQEQRFERFSRRAGPILLDFSRQKLDEPALAALGTILDQHAWQARRDAMFRGDVLNASEQRPVLHTALRAGYSALPSLAPAAVRAEVDETLARMAHMVDAVERSEPGDFDLPEGITDVINLGIGGSDLGPRLAVDALAAFHTGRVRCHFLPNVDGHRTASLMRSLDPRRTLVLLVSKSFTTQETLLNAAVLKEWLVNAYEGNGERANRHFLAVSANVDAARAYGIPSQRVLPMWDYVGGRYSVWSAVGLVLALAVGMDHFRALLRGAAQMDDHFRTADWRDNLPVLLALIGVWNRNGLGFPAHGVIPYHDGLGKLPAFLQQLEMESLGKSVSAEGGDLRQATVPVVWGSVGTNAQHAFFQALHQGTDIVPLDLIGVARPAHALGANHEALLANLLAQGAAFALGKTAEQALAESPAGLDESARHSLAAQRTFAGDRPSSTLLLDSLDPGSFGALLALYEHKVLIQALLWDINAFDQWGVELGKTLAKSILPALASGSLSSFDASTRGLIETLRGLRG